MKTWLTTALVSHKSLVWTRLKFDLNFTTALYRSSVGSHDGWSIKEAVIRERK